MASRAMRLEIAASSAGIADHDRLRPMGRASAANDKAMQELSDVGDLRVGQFESRHGRPGHAVLHYLADRFALLVAQHDAGAAQARAAVATRGVGAMTERAAVAGKECLAPLDRRRIHLMSRKPRRKHR